MELSLSSEQFEDLVKLAYLGNWVINATRTDEEKAKDFEELMQLLYAKSEEGDKGGLAVYDEKQKIYYPSDALEEATDVAPFITELETDIFFNQLVKRLAVRDMVQKFGQTTLDEMPIEQRVEEEQKLIRAYLEYFEQNGIEKLKIET